ncbi:nuclear transcription factor Y subunit B-1 [Lactuca sativa]|uniref:nuclear transcription factor Y subunit B-1 n=1 Tax=Lactuca sativa TaxID=4236 RepID=UPI0022AFD068|nr:nuclear transcription factor Y subunit B-1 [Lactuca sativa]
MAEGPSSPGESGDLSPRSSNVREQDRFLPIANISRIMKKGLPANGKTAKDAKETVQECVSEFISFITSEASDKCLKEKRKTINGDDLLWAMATLGFEDYIEPLKAYLIRYREVMFCFFTSCSELFPFLIGLLWQIEGDTKGSGRKEGVQLQPEHDEGFYSQGLSYGDSQQQGQHLMVPMQGTE